LVLRADCQSVTYSHTITLLMRRRWMGIVTLLLLSERITFLKLLSLRLGALMEAGALLLQHLQRESGKQEIFGQVELK
jgi:hypothetical protein